MSPENRKTWQRFRRNRPALIALWLIGFAVLIAIFGYALAPDHTPDANRQIAEIALRPPGFRASFMAVKINRLVEQPGWFGRLWSGTPPDTRLIPVESWQITGDSVQFVRVGQKTREQVHLVELYATVADSIHRHVNYFYWHDLAGREYDVHREALAQDLNTNRGGRYFFERSFPLGTDKYGRDILSRLILGFRVSLTVGLIAVFISLTIGILLGAMGGYFGGRTDDVIVLIINAVWSIPTLLLVFAIVLALGRGVGIIFLAVGLTMWVDVARLVRGQVLALREMPFVEAAHSMGFGAGRILWRHVLPNLLGPVLVLAAGNFATAILLESGLSYLGFGVQPPAPSWGTLLNENYGYALGGKPMMALAPALAIVLTVLAFNLVGNGLRDAVDVRGK